MLLLGRIARAAEWRALSQWRVKQPDDILPGEWKHMRPAVLLMQWNKAGERGALVLFLHVRWWREICFRFLLRDSLGEAYAVTSTGPEWKQPE